MTIKSSSRKVNITTSNRFKELVEDELVEDESVYNITTYNRYKELAVDEVIENDDVVENDEFIFTNKIISVDVFDYEELKIKLGVYIQKANITLDRYEKSKIILQCFNCILTNLSSDMSELKNCGILSLVSIVLGKINEYESMKVFVKCAKDHQIDLNLWKKLFFSILLVPKHTNTECLIYKTVPEPGTKYLSCSFNSDEHIMDYDFMCNFKNTTYLKDITCVYCSNKVNEEIYEQI
jgi:hypothetical protein